VVRRRRSLARHTALAAFCWACGAWGLSTALAAATWATVAALAAAGLWTQRHRLYVVDEYSGIEHRHQVARALGGDR
jgi:hypothetical protein